MQPLFLVPKLCLGTPSAKLRFAPSALAQEGRRETEFREDGSRTEFGNQSKQSIAKLVPKRCLGTRARKGLSS
jgi:hypothetical protein